MISLWLNYIITWTIFFFLFGVIFYVIDLAFGTKLYRWYHNLVHEEALSRENIIGFVYKRKARSRFFLALTVSFTQSMIMIFWEHTNPLEEMMTVVGETFMMMLGFYIGPIFDRFLKKREKVFDTIDEMEAGNIDAGKVIKTAAHNAGKKVASGIHEIVGDATDIFTPSRNEDTSIPSESTESTKVNSTDETLTPEEDPIQGLRDFLSKK